MAIADWEFFFGSETPGPTIGEAMVTILSPISGTGSLESTHPSGQTTAQTMNTLPFPASPFAHGFDAGRLQTLIRLDDMSGAGGVVSHIGVVAMQKTRDLSYDGSLKDSYAWALEVEEGFASNALVLYKLTQGLNVESGALPVGQELQRVLNPFPGLTTSSVVALELEWRAEPNVIIGLGGAQLIGRAGLNAFTSMTDQVVFLDSSSPLGTTVGEGLFTIFKNSSVATTKTVTFDNTSLYRILVI